MTSRTLRFHLVLPATFAWVLPAPPASADSAGYARESLGGGLSSAPAVSSWASACNFFDEDGSCIDVPHLVHKWYQG